MRRDSPATQAPCRPASLAARSRWSASHIGARLQECCGVRLRLPGHRAAARLHRPIPGMDFGYIAQIAKTYEQEIHAGRGRSSSPTAIVDRNWFNENLIYLWFTVPSLVGILAMLITLIVTALSIARERELGTFDQLLVSPLMPHEILIGKTVPAVVIGMGEGLLIFAVGVSLFGVPYRGSFLLLLFALFIFVLSIAGIGLFLSALSKTQQQAILGAFVFKVPAITLSGYAAPVENMPGWLQSASWINPLKHFLVITKGLFLKDMSFVDVWTNTWPLLVIGFFTVSLSGWFFARRLE